MNEELRSLPNALDRIDGWVRKWREAGTIAVLLDYDGTLAPIVEHADQAHLPAGTRAALEHLAGTGARIAIVSGRGLADVRARVGMHELAYAGNHGMEIEGPGFHQVHAAAVRARPLLDRVVERLTSLAGIPGAELEDKGLTLTIHFRRVDRAHVPRVEQLVRDAVSDSERLRLTYGKEVVEVRPDVAWDKGHAVRFLWSAFRMPSNAPVLYVGDDRTDEDAFVAVREFPAGDGIVVGDPDPEATSATARLQTTEEVARFLDLLSTGAPRHG